ncbi:hydroxysqualene dehydroxylase [Prochlorothrix hollandica]|uniref:Amine oxidase n=1 Tax=Prochlorothrix hollandica PCC 9006 = CALU 1027 TaxID=317619 RepID=A0A0M2PX28_PROHO|nr:FAD-dependent oxidoreductase [Prochlorothrix hollandica]KKJ00986.1 amine oxidase [Prochlorothrix hollandica PCC 9006 = CALU 1027]
MTPNIVVVGAGWAGLGATHHLAKQGYAVTLLEAGPQPGGLVAGWRTASGRTLEAGIHGFWYPYGNIFSLVAELGIQPFTPFTESHQYSPAGLEAEAPLFQTMPPLPAPLGTFCYTRFLRLPLADRLSALPLLQAVVDFDNSPEAWQRYDGMTARELFRRYGVSQRLYQESFEPMLLVGLFAPGEQCSAAAALGMLYYFILAHQADFDVMWCRGSVGDRIFRPWVEQIQHHGGQVLAQKRVTDVRHDGDRVTAVVCGDEVFAADAVIFTVGITGLKKIVAGSPALRTRREFRDVQNLGAIDVLASRLWFDRKLTLPRPSNACFGFEPTTGWTFFDLNALQDEYRDAPGSVIEVDFYHANQFLALDDRELLPIIQEHLAGCIPEFSTALIQDSGIVRLPQAVSHFAPGSYRYLLPGTTSFSNVFMGGDWIVTDHGSWSQEKAYVTGLEAANRVIGQWGLGAPATIVPIQADEPHIQLARTLNRSVRQFHDTFLKSLQWF